MLDNSDTFLSVKLYRQDGTEQRSRQFDMRKYYSRLDMKAFMQYAILHNLGIQICSVGSELHKRS